MDNGDNSLFDPEKNNKEESKPKYHKSSLLSINPQLQDILERYVHSFITKDKEIEIKGKLIDFIRNIH